MPRQSGPKSNFRCKSLIVNRITALSRFAEPFQNLSNHFKIVADDTRHENRVYSPPSEIRKPRKKRSAAVRRKMALAQKARWAKIKQASAPQAASPATKKPKRTMSASARKRIAAAQKKRWAAMRFRAL